MSNLSKMMNMQGRRALITGATGHLGSIIAETLAEVGFDLILIDRPGSRFDEFEKKIIEKWNVKVNSIQCDLEIEGSRDEMIFEIKSDKIGLDCLVNNAAFVGDSKLEGWSCSFGSQSIKTWRRAFEVNLTTAFHLCQAFANDLCSSSNGSIINIASIYGELGPDWLLYEGTVMGNPAAYSASKGGLLQLSRWLATTMAPHVRVNSVTPGGIFRDQPQAFVDRYVDRTPLKRMAVESDFRGGIAFLATDLSKYVTGQNLIIDGGFSVW